ncbi:hypothetical protein GYH30_002882 [Glycine max]|nr:hypothetical protein GYH30_002882 [Glycine max]
MVTMQRLKSTVTGESTETFILVWERKAEACWRSSISLQSLSMLVSTRTSSLVVSSDDGLRDGHSHVVGVDHRDLIVVLGQRGRSHVGYGPEEGLR